MKAFVPFLAICLNFFAAFSHAQSLGYSWARQGGGSGWEHGDGVATDGSGNIIVAGTFYSSSLTLDTITLTKPDSTNPRMFLAKYNPAGDILWARMAATSSTDGNQGYAVATDNNDNIYVSGELWGDTIAFDGNTTVLPVSFGGASFLVKYSPDGTYRWVRTGLGARATEGVATDGSGNVYMSGIFNSGMEINGMPLSTSGAGYGIFIASYDTSGSFQWAKATHYSFDGNGDPGALGKSIATDASSNVYLTGYFGADSIFFDSTVYVANDTSSRNVFLAKYDVNGNVVWARGAEDALNQSVEGTCVKTHGSDVYLSGRFNNDTVRFAGNVISSTPMSLAGEMFLTKYDGSGNNLWAASLGTNSSDDANAENEIAVDSSGNVYLVGTLNGDIVYWNANPADTIVGGNNAAVFEISSAGIYQQLITPVNITLASNSGYGIALDDKDDIFITGEFTGEVAFMTDTLACSPIASDIFVAKITHVLTSSQPATSVSDEYPRVFPNPASGFFTIRLAEPSPSARVDIYEINGRMVHSQVLTGINTIISTEMLPAGLYLFTIRQNDSIRNFKVVVNP